MSDSMTAEERLALCADLTKALGIDLPESVRLYGPGDAVVMILELGTAEDLLQRLTLPDFSSVDEGNTDRG